MANITLRKVSEADRTAVLSVEKRTMPQWQYLSRVFDLFLSHERGEFTVCELDGEIVACAKFTVLPDNSAWLETIRVVPERQGLGIGKRFYENYFEIAKREGIDTLRMYTGTTNAVSKGLAERYGLQLAQTFASMSISTDGVLDGVTHSETFQPVTDPKNGVALIMPHAADWGHYMVMNRTFYRLTAALCEHLVRAGMVYAGEDGVVVLGARFMPDHGLHLGFFAGDATSCLTFARQHAKLAKAPQVISLFPAYLEPIKGFLRANDYSLSEAQFIVMESVV